MSAFNFSVTSSNFAEILNMEVAIIDIKEMALHSYCTITSTTEGNDAFIRDL